MTNTATEIQESLSIEGDLVCTIRASIRGNIRGNIYVYTNTVSFTQDYEVNLEIPSPKEVDNLSDVQVPWALEVRKKGQSLGYLAYGEDWGNDFDIEDELTNLENWIKDNRLISHLYSKEELNRFMKLSPVEIE